jgi:SAM-dependent methyltransferase
MATTIETPAAAYDALAPAYDLLTADYDHERWIGEILRWAGRHGLRGRRALDVACGTGNSFVPLVERGWDVSACDQSAGMLAIAATKVDDPRRMHLHDMRALPVLGSFDLITCLDDALNHLLSARDVRDALSGMAANLAPAGLLVFDVNTVTAYRTAFASCDVLDVDGRLIAWRGLGDGSAQPGCDGEVRIDVFSPDADDADGETWRRTTSVHRERHYPVADISRLAADAGLTIVGSRGQSPGIVLDPDVDEGRHTKALFLARRTSSACASAPIREEAA